jgi:cytochrome P450
MQRMALKAHTFSDGTYVPAGTIIAVPTMPHQLDGENYENPNEFDPFRFENAKDHEATRKYFTSADSEYISFGLGEFESVDKYQTRRLPDIIQYQ